MNVYKITYKINNEVTDFAFVAKDGGEARRKLHQICKEAIVLHVEEL